MEAEIHESLWRVVGKSAALVQHCPDPQALAGTIREVYLSTTEMSGWPEQEPASTTGGSKT